MFCNVVKNAKNDPNLNVTLDNIFKNIEDSAVGYESEDDMKGLFADFDVNNNKLGGSVELRNKLLVKLLNEVANLKLGNYQDNTIDVFGDCYEYLMSMYASSAGKSGGEFLANDLAAQFPNSQQNGSAETNNSEQKNKGEK